MSDESGDKPPPSESTESSGDTSVEQEEDAPPPAEPTQGGEETADVDESTEADDGESTDDETAPELTESVEEDTTEESEDESESESESDGETESETDETVAEGGEQQPLSPGLERHVFEGEVKDNGKLVGYHHREGGEDQGDAKIVEGTKGTPDENGVYDAKWTVDGSDREKYSTFFPDSYTQDDVRGAIREAWGNRTETDVNGQWRGVTSDGITVEGYVGSGKSVKDGTEDDITTAYPLLAPRR